MYINWLYKPAQTPLDPPDRRIHIRPPDRQDPQKLDPLKRFYDCENTVKSLQTWSHNKWHLLYRGGTR